MFESIRAATAAMSPRYSTRQESQRPSRRTLSTTVELVVEEDTYSV